MHMLPNCLLDICLYFYRLVLGSVTSEKLLFAVGNSPQQRDLDMVKVLRINGYWVLSPKLTSTSTVLPMPSRLGKQWRKGGRRVVRGGAREQRCEALSSDMSWWSPSRPHSSSGYLGKIKSVNIREWVWEGLMRTQPYLRRHFNRRLLWEGELLEGICGHL